MILCNIIESSLAVFLKAFLLIVWTPYMCCNALVMFCTYIYQMQIDDSAWLAAKLTIFDETFILSFHW